MRIKIDQKEIEEVKAGLSSHQDYEDLKHKYVWSYPICLIVNKVSLDHDTCQLYRTYLITEEAKSIMKNPTDIWKTA